MTVSVKRVNFVIIHCFLSCYNSFLLFFLEKLFKNIYIVYIMCLCICLLLCFINNARENTHRQFITYQIVSNKCNTFKQLSSVILLGFSILYSHCIIPLALMLYLPYNFSLNLSYVVDANTFHNDYNVWVFRA